ncbi:MAG: restriction endonuclease [Nanoarchaeota archaeon]|nr:restriction endonuclease [Nanoarchaeota archaeon]
MIKSEIFVKKMNGDLERYDSDKLKNSLVRAGASDDTIKKILKKVSEIIYDKIETKKLFDFVFSELKKDRSPSNLKYNLKNAIIDLRIDGGYVFEKFVGKLFGKKGYKINMNEIAKGKFVTHEIDVTARKGKEVLMVEVKHHKNPWLGEQIQTALYIYARFLELKGKYTKPFLVSNTKFSHQVLKYANGMKIGLMGWNYPKGDSLIENIERYKLYPITILGFDKKRLKEYFEEGILTLEDLRKVEGLSKEIKDKIDEIL